MSRDLRAEWMAKLPPEAMELTTLASIRSRDVAPTLARVLGVALAPTDGRALEEILTA